LLDVTFLGLPHLKNSFTVPLAEAGLHETSGLIAKLVSATGSQLEAESILRTMQRMGMGTDPTILGYEMTLMSRGPRNGGVITSAWRVRAQRNRPVVEPSESQPAASGQNAQRR
jgi:hypothetical protein